MALGSILAIKFFLFLIKSDDGSFGYLIIFHLNRSVENGSKFSEVFLPEINSVTSFPVAGKSAYPSIA
jgi:hypothetical protein